MWWEPGCELSPERSLMENVIKTSSEWQRDKEILSGSFPNQLRINFHLELSATSGPAGKTGLPTVATSNPSLSAEGAALDVLQ
ncbi:hypothetical protein chiPu_0013379 [Chiloscyllium punctatum]|uniref:Uncharacterized protein n=1 Tax=Chiloscyllium punctatum TaxID=137246 RepID=A0A401SWW6_CHIPU|nr:hypothetical protein [Chiloscyllium punctatum]